VNFFFTIIVFFFIISGLPSIFAEETGAITLQIKDFSGELVDPYGVSIKIYQDDKNNLYRIMALEQNPQVISDLPSEHEYYFEVLRHGIPSAITLKQELGGKTIDISIPNAGGIKFNVSYSDGSPLPNARVVIKSLDNTPWVTTTTNGDGDTGRFWLQATNIENFYYAEITLGDKISYLYSPVYTSSGTQNEFNIKTPWSKIIDRVDVYVYVDKHKVHTADGIFSIDLYDSSRKKISSSTVTRGTALFTLLPIGEYEFKVLRKSTASESFEEWTKYEAIITQDTSIDIYDKESALENKKSCNCVAFRLDDIQDYFLNNPQSAIIEKFKEKNTPLTIGVIGGLIGSDASLVNLIKDNLRNSNLEIASHFWNNSPIITFPKEQQDKLLKDTNQAIFNAFSVTPRVFIPPENAFDKSTIDLLIANNFTHMSSSFNFDKPPFELSNSTFYRFPQATETAKLNEESNLWIVQNRTRIFDDITSSVNNNGFAVVMMHPPDFAVADLGIYKNEPNSTQIAELGLLIDQIKDAGYSIVSISQINLDSQPLQTPPPAEKSSVLPNCNCVAFRVDNVQDFWLNDVQGKLLKFFEENDADITVGILGKFFGEDPIIINHLNSTIQNKKIQVKFANSGWELVDHSKYDNIAQSSSIQQTNDKVNSIFKEKPTMFISPYGMYDENTIVALEQNGMKYISSNTIQDKPPFAQRNNIVHLPQTIPTVDLFGDDPFLQGTIEEEALLKIRSNFEQYGFSIISMQSPDFAIKNEQNFENKIDDIKFEKFKLILDKIKENNIEIVTMDSIPQILWEKSLDIPEWIKNNADWWSNNQINDSDFVLGIEYMLKEEIIKIPQLPESESGDDQKIPDWVKNNAGWWAQDLISDGDFVSGIEYLVKKGILIV